MRIKYLLLLIGLLLFSHKSYSQDETVLDRLIFVSFEGGFNAFSGDIENTDKIRANISYFDSNTDGLISSFRQTYAGVKTEFFNSKRTFAFSGGLRYTSNSVMVGEGISPSSSFFYFLINSEGTTTEYLRVKQISQKTHYFGVPLEISYLPFKENFIRPYVKAGLVFNFSFAEDTDVTFYDSAMNPRQDELTAKLGESSSFFTAFEPAFGLMLGHENKPSISMELCIPVFFAPQNISALITPYAGFGFQFNLLVPLNFSKSN